MHRRFMSLAVLAAAMFLLAVGCNVVDTTEPNINSNGVVFMQEFCVELDENRTTDSFEKEVVCDQYAAQIAQWMADNDLEPGDVTNIFMMGGRIEEAAPFQGSHAWEFLSSVYIKRQDLGDHAQRFVVHDNVTVPDDIDGAGYQPRFDHHGVRVVNQALRDFVDGGNPILVVKMVGSDVYPAPSDSDPLVFSWRACVDVMAVAAPGTRRNNN